MTPVDQSVIRTTDGCYFTVTGDVQPKGRYVGILSYLPFQPHHAGDPLVVEKDIENRKYVKVSRSWFSPYRDLHFRQITGYEHYIYEDPYFGRVLAITEDRIDKVMMPRPACSDPVAIEACKKLHVPVEAAVLVGSSIMNSGSRDDIDLGILGRENVAKAVTELRRLITYDENRVYNDYFNCTHPRQFMCNGQKIDIFPLYGTDPRPLQTIPRIGSRVQIDEMVEDEFDSAFTPSVYKLCNGKLFITHQTEHKLVLRKGDRIKLNAWNVSVDNRDAFLVRLGDDYEDPTGGRYRFVLDRFIPRP